MFRTASAVALAAFFVPAAAHAVVLDFDTWRPVNQTNTNIRFIPGAIIEDGFRVSTEICGSPSPGSTIPNCFTSVPRRDSIDPTGAAIRTFNQGQTITIAQVDGLAFTFNSIEMLSSYGTTPTSVDIIFNLLDGTQQTIRQPLIPNNQNPATLFTFNVGAVTSVRLDPFERNGAFQFDNIDVSLVAAAVPEPATWAMMIAGFGLAGAALRRQSRAARLA